jgi:thiamine-monophosphate kinase
MATRQADSPLPWGEFELIDRLFAPLAHGLAGAFDLKDDVAALPARAGHELVLKTDTTIESVHFLPGEPPDTVAQKALRRALSDHAAKGSTPEAYLLAIAIPENTEEIWLERFTEGLARDQKQFGIALAGGETNRTPGVLTITITMIGWVPEGRLVRRSGAKAGDDVWVTGSIGDAAGGLCLLKKETVLQDAAARDHLVRRFRVPEPRLKFGMALSGFTSAAIDVSDGLVADLGHVADASGVRIEIDSASVPLSSELRALWGNSEETASRAASAGDDYEIAFTAPVEATGEIAAAARRTLTPAARIGRVVRGPGDVALLDSTGRGISLPRKGYTHF